MYRIMLIEFLEDSLILDTSIWSYKYTKYMFKCKRILHSWKISCKLPCLMFFGFLLYLL